MPNTYQKIFIILFSFFILPFSFTPSFAADKWNTYSLELVGGIDPNGIGSNSILSVGLNKKTAKDYDSIQRIGITIEYYSYNYETGSYIQIARPESPMEVYVSFDRLDLFRGIPLIKNQDYSLYKPNVCYMGVDCLHYDLTLLSRDKLKGDGYLELYFKSFKLLKPGPIKIRVYTYDDLDGVEFTEQGYIDLPVYENIQTPRPTPTPTIIKLTPTSIPTLTELTPTPTPITPTVSANQKTIKLERHLAQLDQQQTQTRKKIERPKTIIESILDFIKRIFQRIPFLNLNRH